MKYIAGFIAGLMLITGAAIARNVDVSGKVQDLNNWIVVNTVLGTMLDAGEAVNATATEINRNNDMSSRLVVLTASTTLNVGEHEGKTILMAEVGGDAQLIVTLPSATGSGARYYFIIGVANTAENQIRVTGTDIFDGYMLHIDGNLQTAANTVADYTASNSDTLNMDSDTTTGGDIGDWVEITDILSGVYSIRGVVRSDADPWGTVWTAEQS